jgi:hypothetical protein
VVVVGAGPGHQLRPRQRPERLPAVRPPRPVDHSTAHQGHGSWADWWADLCAEVRAQRPVAATVTSHTFEGNPGQPCRAEAFGEACGATREQHEMTEAEEIGRLLAQSGANTPGCECGHNGMGPAWHLRWCSHRRTTPDNPPASTNTVDNSEEQQ